MDWKQKLQWNSCKKEVKGTHREGRSWLDDSKTCKYFSFQAPHGVSINIHASQVLFFASRFTLQHWRAGRVWLMVFKGASATPGASLAQGATATDCQSYNGSALGHVFIIFKCWFWMESFINQLKTCCGCNFLFHSYQQDPWHFLSFKHKRRVLLSQKSQIIPSSDMLWFMQGKENQNSFVNDWVDNGNLWLLHWHGVLCACVCVTVSICALDIVDRCTYILI